MCRPGSIAILACGELGHQRVQRATQVLDLALALLLHALHEVAHLLGELVRQAVARELEVEHLGFLPQLRIGDRAAAQHDDGREQLLRELDVASHRADRLLALVGVRAREQLHTPVFRSRASGSRRPRDVTRIPVSRCESTKPLSVGGVSSQPSSILRKPIATAAKAWSSIVRNLVPKHEVESTNSLGMPGAVTARDGG
jgi:hypothetical protein